MRRAWWVALAALEMTMTTSSCSKSKVKVAVVEDAAVSAADASAAEASTLQEGFVPFELDERESEGDPDAGMRHLTRGVSADNLVTIVGKTATHSEPKQGPTGRVDDMAFDIENKGPTPRTIGVSQVQLVRRFGCPSSSSGSDRLQVDTRPSLTKRSMFAYDDHGHSMSEDAGLLTIAPRTTLHARLTLNESVAADAWCVGTAFRVRFQVSSAPAAESALFTQVSATAETHFVRGERIRRKD